MRTSNGAIRESSCHGICEDESIDCVVASFVPYCWGIVAAAEGNLCRAHNRVVSDDGITEDL